MVETIREVMRPNPVTISTTGTIDHAARLMRTHDIGDVLVTDETGVKGILTDRDIVIRAVADSKLPSATPAGECCSTEIHVVQADDSTDEAVRLMRDHGIRRLPVVNDNEVVGIVSIGDLAIARDRSSALADISASEPNT